MKLVDLILNEHDGLPREGIVFLRHGTSQVEILETAEANLHEFTAIQPVKGRYNFYPEHREPPEVVVVIVRDKVHAVYRLEGISETGPIGEICSDTYKAFEVARRVPLDPDWKKQAVKYGLSPLESGALGGRISGWEGRGIATVQWHDGSFFEEVVVDAAPLQCSSWVSHAPDLEWQEGNLTLRTHLRKERSPNLASAKRKAFRNLYGRLFCENCREDPVQRYGAVEAECCLEVHHAATTVADMKPGHMTQLSELQLLCANCHRLVHARLRATAAWK